MIHTVFSTVDGIQSTRRQRVQRVKVRRRVNTNRYASGRNLVAKRRAASRIHRLARQLKYIF
jgi:hypothetical protein